MWSLCCPRDSQESSAPQFQSVSLHSLNLISGGLSPNPDELLWSLLACLRWFHGCSSLISNCSNPSFGSKGRSLAYKKWETERPQSLGTPQGPAWFQTWQYSHLLQEVSPSRSIEAPHLWAFIALIIVMFNTTQTFVLVSLLNLNDEHTRENDGE